MRRFFYRSNLFIYHFGGGAPLEKGVVIVVALVAEVGFVRETQNTSHRSELRRPWKSRNIQGTFKEHSGNVHGTFKERSRNVQGTFKEHSGNIHGTFREHSGNIQGTFREHSGINRPAASSSSSGPAG
eukprot:1680812-Pyramimonas_sp.AAC.1